MILNYILIIVTSSTFKVNGGLYGRYLEPVRLVEVRVN
jgi:hypothetical protein